MLDLNLPDMDGMIVLERIRGWSKVPVIVLSVRASDDDKVRLLEAGADDYVVKPFSMPELLARARTALRRQARGAHGEPVIKAGPLSIDLAARAVFVDGARVVLSPKEYRLLQVLAQQGRILGDRGECLLERGHLLGRGRLLRAERAAEDQLDAVAKGEFVKEITIRAPGEKLPEPPEVALVGEEQEDAAKEPAKAPFRSSSIATKPPGDRSRATWLRRVRAPS